LILANVLLERKSLNCITISGDEREGVTRESQS